MSRRGRAFFVAVLLAMLAQQMTTPPKRPAMETVVPSQCADLTPDDTFWYWWYGCGKDAGGGGGSGAGDLMDMHTSTSSQSRFAFDVVTTQRFAEYHAANPRIYAALRRFALEAKRAGRKRIGMKALFERVRWFTDVEAKGDTFKANNTWTAHYARLLMEQESELAGFFETRKAKADRG